MSLEGKQSWNKGKKMSEESRAKMSNSHKGIEPWNKGKVGVQSHSIETRNKMKLSQIERRKKIKESKK